MKNSTGSSRAARIATWVAIVAVAATAFVSFGGVGLAQNVIGLHQYQYGKKVTVCHKGRKTIQVSLRGWLHHKRHGDRLGACKKWKWKKHRMHTKRGRHGSVIRFGKGKHGTQLTLARGHGRHHGKSARRR